MIPTLLVTAVLGAAAQAKAPDITWRKVAKGVEYAALTLAPKPSAGDGLLHVVRIDPSKARLRALAVKREGGEARTARQWREKFKLAAVINAGMFDIDDRSRHVGFFRVGEHVNSSKWVKTYQSVLVFDPRKADLPAAAIHDAASGEYAHYGTVVQNLRLIRAPGVSVWKENGRRWSEAAIAADRDGKILFLFTRSPYSMYELNRILLALPLGIARAMHTEGGPEASLSLRGNGVDLNLSGSYETGFKEDDQNQEQWPIPNVIGVEAEPEGE